MPRVVKKRSFHDLKAKLTGIAKKIAFLSHPSSSQQKDKGKGTVPGDVPNGIAGQSVGVENGVSKEGEGDDGVENTGKSGKGKEKESLTGEDIGSGVGGKEKPTDLSMSVDHKGDDPAMPKDDESADEGRKAPQEGDERIDGTSGGPDTTQQSRPTVIITQEPEEDHPKEQESTSPPPAKQESTPQDGQQVVFMAEPEDLGRSSTFLSVPEDSPWAQEPETEEEEGSGQRSGPASSALGPPAHTSNTATWRDVPGPSAVTESGTIVAGDGISNQRAEDILTDPPGDDTMRTKMAKDVAFGGQGQGLGSVGDIMPSQAIIATSDSDSSSMPSPPVSITSYPGMASRQASYSSYTSDSHQQQTTGGDSPETFQQAGNKLQSSPQSSPRIQEQQPKTGFSPTQSPLATQDSGSFLASTSPKQVALSAPPSQETSQRTGTSLHRHTSSASSVSGSSYSPRPGSSHGPGSGIKGHHRRRSSSANRTVIETRGATVQNLDDGRKRLNQYEFKQELGKGSFGSVELAVDMDTGKKYAIKEFSKARLRKRAQSELMRAGRGRGPRGRGGRPSSSHSMGGDKTPGAIGDDPLALIRSEIAIMKKLVHPNVVKLYEVLDVQGEDSLYMVVELCPGGTLCDVSLGKTAEGMSEDQARMYFRQIVLGIEYLHHNDIAHRDIKPDNILLDDDREIIKIVDFGVSEMFFRHDDDKSTKTVGSPAFMSPELCISHHGEIRARCADIWAMGVTLYCMLVGKLPFESAQFLELYDLIKNQPVVLPKSLSADAQDVLSRLLTKDPDERIAMSELREHPWLTKRDELPMPTVEENCQGIGELTEEDLDSAFKSIRAFINAASFAKKLHKKWSERKSISQGSGPGENFPFGTSSSTSSSDPNQRPRMVKSDSTSSSVLSDESSSPSIYMSPEILPEGIEGDSRRFQSPTASDSLNLPRSSMSPSTTLSSLDSSGSELPPLFGSGGGRASLSRHASLFSSDPQSSNPTTPSPSNDHLAPPSRSDSSHSDADSQGTVAPAEDIVFGGLRSTEDNDEHQ